MVSPAGFQSQLLALSGGRNVCGCGAVGERVSSADLGFGGRNDTDHVIAVYRVDGHWGAIAKSNYTGCRGREPVYRSLRELAMSYFNLYFNMRRERTLRGIRVR